MRKIPKPVLVLHADTNFTACLRAGGLKYGFEPRSVGDWEELLDAMRAAPASSIVVVDPYFGTGKSGLSIELAAFLNRFPSVAVTAALHVERGRYDDLRRLGEWGVVQVLDLDEEVSGFGVAQRLLSTHGRPLRALVERALPPWTSGAARSILAEAVAVSTIGGRGTDLARRFYITPRTLTRWCRRAALPPPRQLLAWIRVLLAAELLDDRGRTVADVALSCGYSGDSSLRTALRRFLGDAPAALRQSGAFRVASQRFLQSLREARSTNRRYRSAKGRTS